ncbi:MAG: hypothetical protein OEW83_09215 [Acidimicrobiia bacterium]|nr:hypothetical protein [Acidimicrobiia bacterium]
MLIDHDTPFVLTDNDNNTWASSPLGLRRNGVHLDPTIEPTSFTLRDDNGAIHAGQIRIRREDR